MSSLILSYAYNMPGIFYSVRNLKFLHHDMPGIYIPGIYYIPGSMYSGYILYSRYILYTIFKFQVYIYAQPMEWIPGRGICILHICHHAKSYDFMNEIIAFEPSWFKFKCMYPFHRLCAAALVY